MGQSTNRFLRLGVEAEEYLSKTEKTTRASEWRASRDGCAPDPMVVEGLSKINEKVTIVCFCAIWCKDCIRNVSELAMTLRRAKNRNLRLVIIDYDQNNEVAKEANVKAIPTFIAFSAKGSETVRIIENPSPPYKSIGEELLNRLTSD